MQFIFSSKAFNLRLVFFPFALLQFFLSFYECLLFLDNFFAIIPLYVTHISLYQNSMLFSLLCSFILNLQGEVLSYNCHRNYNQNIIFKHFSFHCKKAVTQKMVPCSVRQQRLGYHSFITPNTVKAFFKCQTGDHSFAIKQYLLLIFTRPELL